MSDRETIAFYDTAATDFASPKADGPPGPALARFMDLLTPGNPVLDLGCGHGVASAHLSRAGYQVTGLDASEGLLSIAKTLAPDASLRHATFDDLTDVAAYDGIWCNFALVHAPRADLPRHLAAIARALTENGLLHLSMILGDGEIRDDRARAYTYVSEPEFDALLAEAGFTILNRDIAQKQGLDKPETTLTVLAQMRATL